MTEVEQSPDVKQKDIVAQARAQSDHYQTMNSGQPKDTWCAELARLLTELADEIERLQKDIDTFRELHGGNRGET